jgi:hypothetical protein
LLGHFSADVQKHVEGGKEVMKQEEGRQEERRPYQKPMMEQVELAAEEQVLGGCKTPNDGGGVGTVAGESCNLDGNCVLDGT